MPSKTRALPRSLIRDQKCCLPLPNVDVAPHVLVTLMVSVHSGLLEFIRDGRNHHPGAFLWKQHGWSSFPQVLALMLVISRFLVLCGEL